MPEDNTTTTPIMTDSSSPTPAPTGTVSDFPLPTIDPATDIPTSPVVVDPTADIPASPAVVDPSLPDQPSVEPPVETPSIYQEVTGKIAESRNVLVALSSDPSVDEMCAAIGLTIFLDKLGKRATAIYSGATPNALEFLKPEETFESTADVLQDFVIALNKEKADHLRYKLDGDYVKIYITPYRAKITADDLEFSYGDFNVDLVLALDVANGIDLDSALREHGRIMHDAVIINITTGNPGKFGEIEWSDKKASSVSEMIARLLYSVKSDVEIGKEEATAFLTGIVAATNRFSNAQTTPETMQLASRLMNSGANQQLIAKNITPDIDNEMYSLLGGPNISSKSSTKSKETDPTNLDIQHEGEEEVDETKEIEGTVTEKESTLLDDLKAAEASLAQTGAETTPDLSNQPVHLDSTPASEPTVETSEPETESPEPAEEPAEESAEEPAEKSTEESSAELPEPTLPSVESTIPEVETTETSEEPDSPESSSTEPVLPEVEPVSATSSEKGEKVLTPSSSLGEQPTEEDSSKYGHMLEEALEELTNPGSATALNSNPATASTPIVSSEPEINGVPEMNFMPPAGSDILPPPPAPPVDMSTDSIDASLPTTPIEPAGPIVEPTPEPLGPQPAMQDQVYRPQSSDPGAFKIPGM